MCGIYSKRKTGFTFIEILVVVAIISILTTILVANYNAARENSRDKIRKSDLKSLQLAIELYKAQNGMYPQAGCGAVHPSWSGSESSYPNAPSIEPCGSQFIEGLVPDFLPSEPGPAKDDKGYSYTVDATRSSYKILSHHNVENQFVTGYDDEFARYNSTLCQNPFPVSEKDVYAVYSAGAECW
jgi:prepilin-type N-terminal cleavage/methylation domain-containing protein